MDICLYNLLYIYSIYRDAITVSLINCSTSFIGGFATFTVLGFVATTLGKDVQDVIASGRCIIGSYEDVSIY